MIGKLGSKAKTAVPALIEALGDKDETVQLEAIAALGEIGAAAQNAAPFLLKLISDDDKSILEPFIVSALGNMGPGISDFLREGLADKLAQRRRVAAEAFGLLGPSAKASAPALAGVLAMATLLRAARLPGPSARSGQTHGELSRPFKPPSGTPTWRCASKQLWPAGA